MITGMPPDLCDIIDWDLAEDMLLQHDHYEFHDGVAVSKNGRATWQVFVDGVDHNCFLNPGPDVDPVKFNWLASALQVATSPRFHEQIEERRTELAKAKEAMSNGET